MSSFASLNIGASGLFAASRAVEVAAHNISNANTEGYTRQRLTVQTAMPVAGTQGLRGDGMRGMGVQALSADRLRDNLADVAYRSEAGVSGAADARSTALSRTQSTLGPYSSGAPEAFSTFLASWDQLSLTPTDPAARTSVLATGKALADSLNGTSTGLGQVADEMGAHVQDEVGELNGLLTHVASLNTAIRNAVVDGQQPNDLMDDRDNALDRVTYLTGATVTHNADSSVDVDLGGTPLVSNTTAATVAATTGSPVSVTADGTAVTPAGQIGGYVSVVNVDIPDYQAKLDSLANGLRDAVNAVHHGSTGLDGSTGTDFFTGDGAAALAVNPDLTTDMVAASASGATADGNGALAMSALRTSKVLDGATATLTQGLVSFGASVGQAVTDATRNASTASAGLTGAQQVRASSNGVNVDEEMVDLVKYQHSYAAASRVITVVDGMLDKIINQMGH